MSKRRIMQLAAVAAAIPALLMGTSGSASASGPITWTNDATGGCLVNAIKNDNSGYHVYARVPSSNDLWTCGFDSDTDTKKWVDSQNNLENPDGAWAQRSGLNGDYCLAMWPDSNEQGHVYLEPCSSPVNYYQQWYEKWDGHRFNLVNRQTGMCLDSNKREEVYAMKCNGGNNQRWF